MPFSFASPLGHVSQGTSRVVGLGDVSRHFCRTMPKPFPSVWEAFGTAFMMRSGLTVRAASFFSGPPRCVAVRIAAKTPSTCICTQVGACGHELQRHGVEIVDGLSEVAGQPLALRVARLARR